MKKIAKNRKNRKVVTEAEAMQFAAAVNRIAAKTTELELTRLREKGIIAN